MIATPAPIEGLLDRVADLLAAVGDLGAPAAVKLDPNRQRVRCTFASGTLFPDQRAAVDRFAAIAGGSPRHDRIGTSVYSLSARIDGLLLEVVALRAVESAWHSPRRRRGSTAELERAIRTIAPWAGTLNAEMVCDLGVEDLAHALGVSLVLRGPHVVAYTEQLLAELPAGRPGTGRGRTDRLGDVAHRSPVARARARPRRHRRGTTCPPRPARGRPTQPGRAA